MNQNELMPFSRFRAAVFDMDGLLLDSERPIRDAWLAATREFGVALADADYLELVGRNSVDSRRLLQQWLGEAVSYDVVRQRAAALIDEALGVGGDAVKGGGVGPLEGPPRPRRPGGGAASTHPEEGGRPRGGGGGGRGFLLP